MDLKQRIESRFKRVVDPMDDEHQAIGLQELPVGHYNGPSSYKGRTITTKLAAIRTAVHDEESAAAKELEERLSNFSGDTIYWRTFPEVRHIKDWETNKVYYRGLARFNWI